MEPEDFKWVDALGIQTMELRDPRQADAEEFVVLARSTSSSYGHECNRLEGEVASLWDLLVDVEEKASTLEDTLQEEQRKREAFKDKVENPLAKRVTSEAEVEKLRTERSALEAEVNWLKAQKAIFEMRVFELTTLAAGLRTLRSVYLNEVV
ncbi:hypothetical protein GUJ93_ZPchr0010g7621 [Zizania palustris]|uniref:Uncharacterized protein n=1 Tax=Zizania palustris TaxID=103762 RepID=A0A8J5THV4_ZIZPA|nr:hypothetical protein GUJ93_ZPchr0010g7621 [Zizania palustris]